MKIYKPCALEVLIDEAFELLKAIWTILFKSTIVSKSIIDRPNAEPERAMLLLKWDCYEKLR